jgi:hypothetical protein
MNGIKPLILETLALSGERCLTKNRIAERLHERLGYNPYSAVHRLLSERSGLIRDGCVMHHSATEKSKLDFVVVEGKTRKAIVKRLRRKKVYKPTEDKRRSFTEYSLTLRGLIDYLAWLLDNACELEILSNVFDKQTVNYPTPLFMHWLKLRKIFSDNALLFALRYTFENLRYSRLYPLLKLGKAEIEKRFLQKMAFHFLEGLELSVNFDVDVELTKIAEYALNPEFNELIVKMDNLKAIALKFKTDLE